MTLSPVEQELAAYQMALRICQREIVGLKADLATEREQKAALLEACKLALFAFENRSAIDWDVLSNAIAKATQP